MSYYHGGISGLRVGERLLPSSVTGNATTIKWVAAKEHKSGYVRGDRVYVTSDKQAARVYASVVPNGSLYEVNPCGQMGEDPDAPGVSWTCEYAEIIRVIEPRVKFKIKRFVKFVHNAGAIL